VQDTHEQHLLTRAFKACLRRAGTPLPREERTRFSALELIIRAEEVLGARERFFGADWLGAHVVVRVLSAGLDRDVSTLVS
jgi:hypothetical protein